MKVFLIVAMAFIVPLAGIAIFILFDKGLDKLLDRLKNKGRNKRYAQIQPVTPSADKLQTGQLPVIQPGPNSSPKVSGCKSCPGCKSAAKGGCPRNKQAGAQTSSNGQ